MAIKYRENGQSVTRANIGGGGGGSTATIVVNNSTGDLTGASIVVKYGSTVISTTNHIGDNIQVGAIGVYTIECGVYSVDVTVTALGTMVYADVNTTDSWKLWLEAGGLDPDDYDNLAEVLADEKAVRRLMTIHASVDFLANGNKNATLISTIVNDNHCAKWINLRDYALDILYANEDIAELMDTADKYFYGEWVNNNGTWGPKGNVPVMTSNTAPYGKASASNENATDYAAWKAFDGNDATLWSTNANVGTGTLSYCFTNPVCVKHFLLYPSYVSHNGIKHYKIQGSNDNTNWVDLYEETLADENRIIKHNISNANYYLYYRIYSDSTYHDTGKFCIKTLQFYGREMKVSVPTMTSNTAPYGEASASSEYDATSKAYTAFDSDNSTRWISSVRAEAYVQYRFTSAVCIKNIYVNCASQINTRIRQYTISASSDGNNFTELYNGEKAQAAAYIFAEIPDNKMNDYQYYRFTIKNTYDGYEPSIWSLQFYGLDYSEYDWDTEHPRHYIYDHGVELETLTDVIVGTNSVVIRRSDSIEFYVGAKQHVVADTYCTLDLTSYNLLRGVTGEKMDKNVSLSVWSQTPSYTNTGRDGNQNPISSGLMPYNMALDVSSINGSKLVALHDHNNDGTTAGGGIYTEWWLE